MRNLAILVALAAITALGVAATVSASTRTVKRNAACNADPACATMSAADCAACPMGGQPGCGSCDMAKAKSAK